MKLKRIDRERLLHMLLRGIPVGISPSYRDIADPLVARRMIKHVRTEMKITPIGAYKSELYELTKRGRHAALTLAKQFNMRSRAAKWITPIMAERPWPIWLQFVLFPRERSDFDTSPLRLDAWIERATRQHVIK